MSIIKTKELSVGELRKMIDAIPRERDSEPVAVYELNDGLRFNVIHLDSDCSGVIDLNFESDQYNENKQTYKVK